MCALFRDIPEICVSKFPRMSALSLFAAIILFAVRCEIRLLGMNYFAEEEHDEECEAFEKD